MIEKVRVALCLRTAHQLRSLGNLRSASSIRGMRCRYHCASPNLYPSHTLIYVFSAYELYADPTSDIPPVGSQETDGQENLSKAGHFKKTFSNENVKVHFVGAWCIF